MCLQTVEAFLSQVPGGCVYVPRCGYLSDVNFGALNLSGIRGELADDLSFRGHRCGRQCCDCVAHYNLDYLYAESTASLYTIVRHDSVSIDRVFAFMCCKKSPRYDSAVVKVIIQRCLRFLRADAKQLNIITSPADGGACGRVHHSHSHD